MPFMIDMSHFTNTPIERPRTPKGYKSRATMTAEERKIKRADNLKKNPAMSQKGKKMPESTRITATLNWKRRCIMGVRAQTKAHTMYWIFRSKVFNELSIERREFLEVLNEKLATADKLLKEIVDSIDNLKNLPKWSQEALPRHRKTGKGSQRVK